jgi:heme/copper-type cytochrome/quinol oxidase subunit 2
VKRLLQRARSLRVTLWTLIVPPTVWAAHFLFSYLWAAVSCAKLGVWARFPTAFAIGTVIALLVIVASGIVAWQQSRTRGDPPPHNEGTDIDRLRFLAYATMLLAGLSFVAVIFTAAPVIVLSDCR